MRISVYRAKGLSTIGKALQFVIAVCILNGCDLAGVPDYERRCREYLMRHGYSWDTVWALLEHKPLEPDMVTQLICVPDSAVRIMLAENPCLTFAERQILWRDKDEYVRRAIAMNLRLSHEEMLMIISKQPYTVLTGLARNPAAPQEVLLRVSDKLRKRAYGDFSMNPNCPQEIIDEIMSADNGREAFISSHQDWVRRTQERKEQFRQAKAQGKPFPKGYYPWSHAELWWRDEDK